MNKQLNAKLQYALDGLSLSKEQKQALIDVFAEIGNNSGGDSGGQSDTVYVELISEYEKPPIVKINDYEITESDYVIDTNEGVVNLKIHNEKLYNYLKLCYYEKRKFVITEYIEDIEFNLVRPRSYTYPTLFGYYDDISPYFSIGYKLDETIVIIVYEH